MNNNNIYVSYGESLRLVTEITADLTDLESLTLYIGKGGDTLPSLTLTAVITADKATIYAQTIELEIGEYLYQYKAVYKDGSIDKFPEIDCCNTELPKFIVTDSIDDVESN